MECAARAVCRSCGGPTPPGYRNTIRLYCDRPECQREKRAAARRGRKVLQLGQKRWCSACALWKTLTEENFCLRVEDGRVVYADTYCRGCRAANNRDRYRTNEGWKKRARERARQQRARIKKRREEDPEFDREYREQRRRWNEARKRKDRDGGGKDGRRSKEERPRSTIFVPVGPFRNYLKDKLKVMDQRELGRLVGVDEKMVRRWIGEQETVHLTSVDLVYTRLGEPWLLEEHYPLEKTMLGRPSR